MGFRSPLSAAQIAVIVGGAVPTAAAIDAQPNSATAATQATTAASNSAVARIRSMTRIAFTMTTADLTLDLPLGVTDINRCQVQMIGAYLDTTLASGSDFDFGIPDIYAVSNTAISLTRKSSSYQAKGFVEVMEWI